MRERLERAITCLLQRIEPVLQPATPSGQPPKSVRSPLGGVLHDYTDALIALTDRIEDAESRIQL